MLTLDTAHTADAQPCVLLGEAAALPVRMATTGSDLVLPAVVAATVILAGVALVVADRRRRVEVDGWSVGALLVGLVLAVGLVAGGIATGASATENTSESSQPGCALLDIETDGAAGHALIGGAAVEIRRVTVRNPTAFDIDVDLATEVTRDADGLAPFVEATTICSCSNAAVLRSVLAGGARTAQAVRIVRGQSVEFTVSAVTTADIENRLQGSTLEFALTAYARQVTA